MACWLAFHFLDQIRVIFNFHIIRLPSQSSLTLHYFQVVELLQP